MDEKSLQALIQMAEEYQRFQEQVLTPVAAKAAIGIMTLVQSPGFQQTIAAALDLIATIEPKIRSVGEYLTSPAFKQALKRWAEENDELVDWYGVAMVQAGWPPTLRLPEPLRLYIGRLARRGEPTNEIDAGVSKVLRDHYEDSMRAAILADWTRAPLLNRRLPILESVLRAYDAGEYWVVVPTALAQVEGIIAEGFGLVGWVPWKKIKQQHLPALLTGTARELLGGHGMSLMEEMVLKNFQHGDPIPTFNRHAILHGADVAFGTQKTALKSILLLDYIQSAFRFVATGSGHSYHLPGCGALKRRPINGPVRHTYPSAEHAEAARLKPCKQCKPERLATHSGTIHANGGF